MAAVIIHVVSLVPLRADETEGATVRGGGGFRKVVGNALHILHQGRHVLKNVVIYALEHVVTRLPDTLAFHNEAIIDQPVSVRAPRCERRFEGKF
jgi:ectoine hydroxylase-related dioxygenase (phytanoyl-CoA dioxygenase family)